MEEIINRTHVPPIQDCTPYQMHAMTARLMTGHKDPQTPNEALEETGKLRWYFAPILPVRQTKQPAIAYPSHVHIQDSYHERPPCTFEADIIQVLMLKQSAIQKATKFLDRHIRRSGSTGFRSSFVSISCALLSPGSLSTANRSRTLPSFERCSLSMIAKDGGVRYG